LPPTSSNDFASQLLCLVVSFFPKVSVGQSPLSVQNGSYRLSFLGRPKAPAHCLGVVLPSDRPPPPTHSFSPPTFEFAFFLFFPRSVVFPATLSQLHFPDSLLAPSVRPDPCPPETCASTYLRLFFAYISFFSRRSSSRTFVVLWAGPPKSVPDPT